MIAATGQSLAAARVWLANQASQHGGREAGK